MAAPHRPSQPGAGRPDEDEPAREPRRPRDVRRKLVRKLGLPLATDLCGAIRQVRIWGFDHPNLRAALERLVDSVRSFAAAGEAPVLEVDESCVSLNGVRVRATLGSTEALRFLRDELTRLGVGAIELQPRLTHRELRELANAINEADHSLADPFAVLAQRLERAGVQAIAVRPPQRVDAQPKPRLRTSALQTYLRTVAAAQSVQQALQLQQQPRITEAKRAVQGLIEQMEQDDEQMLTLTAVKRLVDYQSAHAVNTSILAVAHGNRLGLPRKTLAELGVAALFLDMGMSEVAAAIADADRPLSPTERQELERHPLLAAQSFLHCESLTDVALRCMQAALEHHRNYDGGGYPEFDGHPPPSFQARLLRICDVYDALTSPRPFRPQPMAPERALQAMLAESGTAFDPLLLKSFINTVGIYPLGALVELNTGELGTVYRFGLDPAELDRPWIRVFAGPDGERVDQLVDLSETDANGEHVRRIARVVAAEELALEVGDHLALL